MAKYIQIVTTLPSKKDAEKISDNIIKNKLAACSQIIGPVKSKYWWEQKIDESEEWMCIFKSTKKMFKSIEHKIKELHPYDLPEIISTKISGGSNEYLDWIDKVTVKKNEYIKDQKDRNSK